MAKGNRGGRRSGTGGGSFQPTQTFLTQPRNYQQLSDSDAADLRDDQDDLYDGSVTAATKMYISGKPGTGAANVDGQGHSLSQTMNYLLENGEDLNASTVQQINSKYGLNIDARNYTSMQYVQAYMDAGAHTIGKDITLTRYAHDTVLQTEFGMRNYASMKEAQLQKALVGQAFTNKAYLSTSYDASKSPFASSAYGIGGGREVIYNIKASSNTKMLFGAKSQAEIVLARGTQFQITGVRYTGNYATPRGGSTKPQIIIDIETV